MSDRPEPTDTANRIYKARFPDAKVLLLSGSVMRGEGTAYSDLDIVVLFESVKSAWRESFIFEGWPVEIFAHDAETLLYFFEEIDASSGVPSLPSMVAESVAIPRENQWSTQARDLALTILAAGPAPWSEQSLTMQRYALTDLIDDIREPRTSHELQASGGRLYETLADFILRSNNSWSARGKTIPRKLHQLNEALAEEFTTAFDSLFKHNDAGGVIALTEKILKPHGGFLFEGHKLEAPPDWRKKIVGENWPSKSTP